jgi:pectinesterase
MRSKWFFLLIGVFMLSLTLPQQQKVKVYMVGDSTMANKAANKFPETGWGQVFNECFNSNVTIANHAQNGRSTKSFINEKRWQAVLDSLKQGDYVFIEFGHNDEKVEKPAVGTTLDEFRTNLIKYVTEARAKKAIPILLTPVERRSFKDGQLTDSHGKYPDVVRAVAKEFNVPFIDMQLKSRATLLTAGEGPSAKLFLQGDSGVLANYPKGVKDNTHFNQDGAKTMAGLAAQGIRELNLPLAKYLK